MKVNKNKQTKLMATIIACVAAAVIWISLAAGSGRAADEYLDEFLAYGVANISQGQTARLHVVSIGNPEVQPVELVIYDKLGNVLARSFERLQPGRAAALDLRFADQNTGTAVIGNRLEFSAVVRFNKLHRGYVIPSLEVMDDATGRTNLLVIDPLA